MRLAHLVRPVALSAVLASAVMGMPPMLATMAQSTHPVSATVRAVIPHTASSSSPNHHGHESSSRRRHGGSGGSGLLHVPRHADGVGGPTDANSDAHR